MLLNALANPGIEGRGRRGYGPTKIRAVSLGTNKMLP